MYASKSRLPGIMLWCMVLCSLLAPSAQAFAPAPIRWGGNIARRFLLAPDLTAFSSRVTAAPHKLTLIEPFEKMSSNAIPHFSANADNTITLDATGLCVEATGTANGDAVLVNHCTGAPNQRWNWLPWKGWIQLRGTDQCLDVVDKDDGLSGTPIELRSCENVLTESWIFDGSASAPTQYNPQHSTSSFATSHALIAFISMVAVGSLSVSAWWWRQQPSHAVVTTEGGASMNAVHCGVSLTEQMVAVQGCAPLHAIHSRDVELVAAKMTLNPKGIETEESSSSFKSKIAPWCAKARSIFLDIFPRIVWIGLYFSIGIAVYGLLEGWTPIDASYFMMVTSTTVGYGDFVPASDAGKLFTCLYALLGTTLIVENLTPFVRGILRPIRSKIEKTVRLKVDTFDPTLTLAEVKARISYPRRYLRAVLGPLLLFIVGVIYAALTSKLRLVDCIYWSMMSMTTIGFGDLTPAATPTAKFLALLYLPLAVTALTDALVSISNINARRAIRDTDLLEGMDHTLLRAAKGNPHKSLTELEFLIQTLAEYDLVDEATCLSIRRQFAAEIYACDDDVEDGCTIDKVQKLEEAGQGPMLGPRTVYNTLKRNGSLTGEDANLSYDSYEDWLERSWKVRVAAEAGREKT